ncbi:LamG-like jellyroll fold domain-containing protein [Streptomyces shenzhenensis]|uniref:LamG-like jellyroll fold domain-containing protein n=1 Tax=Streptomyces shenzhenensis TaxID=943815 RepID=UPI00382954AF
MASLVVLTVLLAILPLLGVDAPVANADSGSGNSEARAAAKKAADTGERVEVPGERTEYASTYANPDGMTFTLEQSAVPVRVRGAAGGWVAPDAALEFRPDGGVAPRAAVVDLEFSAGGDGSGLVRVAKDGRSLELGWPGELPRPTLDGASAVYADVLPGVDLRMTATVEGFRELLVVKTPEAAANPVLRRIELSLKTDGLTVSQTAAGGMTAVDENARPLFSSPPALMWNSPKDTGGMEAKGVSAHAASPAGAQVADPSGGTQSDPADGPGNAASSTVLPIEVGEDVLAVVPDAELLANTHSSDYPIYIDPSVGLDQTARTLLRSDGYTEYNWGNGSDNEGKGMGHCSSYDGYYCGPGYTQRLYFQFSPSKLAGKKVLSATFRVTETWSFTCDERSVDLVRTNSISSSTTWASRPSHLGTAATRKVSAGRGTLCSPSQPEAPIEFTDSRLTKVASDFAAGKFSKLTLLLKAQDETDTSAWKRFRNNAVLSVTYVGLPAVPTGAGIVESGGTSCATNSADPDVVADPNPTMTAKVMTASGGGSGASLRARFYMQKRESDGWSVVTEPVRPSSGFVANNTVVSVASPVKLSEGSLYRMAVFARSYHDNGSSYVESHSTLTTKGWCYFTVDPTAPKAPKITFGGPYSLCTANACTPAGGPGIAGKFTFSPASGDNNAAYQYKLSSSSAWSSPLPGSTVQPEIVPQLAGTQQLQVRAKDLANRWGAMAAVEFKVAEGQTAVGRWHFDDAKPNSGVTKAADTATEGVRHPATLYTAGTGWSGFGRRGDGDYSLWLNDTSNASQQNGYAATDQPVINTKSSFTVSAWAYPTDDSTYRTVMSEFGSDGSGFSLYYSSGVQRWVFVWYWYENGVRKYQGVNAAVAGIPLKTWTHLAAVYDASPSTRTISLYVNGRIQGSPVDLPSGSDMKISDGALQFGRDAYPAGGDRYWKGRLDEAAVWQRPLTQDEIATEARLLNADGTSAVELVAAWDPEGKSGTTLADTVSGYGRSLALSGGATLDGTSIALNGTDGAAATAGPVVDAKGSFTVSTEVALDSKALLSKEDGYTAQVLGQHAPDGSAWGLWYQRTGVETVLDDDFNEVTVPVGFWKFGRLEADKTFTAVQSDETVALDTPVRITGDFDGPSRVIRLFLDSNENDAGVEHTFTAMMGAGDFAVGKGYAAGDTNWAHYLPGKITNILIWAGTAASSDQLSDMLRL